MTVPTYTELLVEFDGYMIQQPDVRPPGALKGVVEAIVNRLKQQKQDAVLGTGMHDALLLAVQEENEAVIPRALNNLHDVLATAKLAEPRQKSNGQEGQAVRDTPRGFETFMAGLEDREIIDAEPHNSPGDESAPALEAPTLPPGWREVEDDFDPNDPMYQIYLPKNGDTVVTVSREKDGNWHWSLVTDNPTKEEGTLSWEGVAPDLATVMADAEAEARAWRPGDYCAGYESAQAEIEQLKQRIAELEAAIEARTAGPTPTSYPSDPDTIAPKRKGGWPKGKPRGPRAKKAK
jgi:hypothetical protein